MTSPAQVALAALPADAPVNDKREALNAIYDTAMWRGQPRTAPYVPWFSAEEVNTVAGKEKRNLFEQGLVTDKAAAFKERVKFYDSQGLLKEDVLSWLDCPVAGEHAVYMVLEQEPCLMFTIGNALLYNLPEVVLFFDASMSPLSCGRYLNELVQRLRCGEELLGQSAPGDVAWQHASTEELKLLGMMSWFHRNFLDRELCESDVWVAQMPPMPIDGEEDIEMNEVYESEGNVCHLEHGLVSEKPLLQLGPTVPPELLQLMTGGLDEDLMEKLRRDLKEEVLTPWAFKHGSAVLHGQDLINHMLKEARRVQREKENGNADCKAHAEISDLMQVAVSNNQPESVAQLAELGMCGERLKGNGADRSLLMQAVQAGFDGVVEQLLKYKAPLHDTDHEQWTALSLAAHGQVHGDQRRAVCILDMIWDAGARLM
mmetsp:Transcript_155659/g.270528  ORF Transcript_155659/g.270528 Transcript_155659/m.270528 type:complete len:429 (-) Transcript_155659:93-1379(-)